MRIQQRIGDALVGLATESADVPTLQRIGLNARTIRRERRLSLSDVAGAAGITVGALSRIETGHKTPSLQTLVRVCEVMGVSVAEVFRRPPVWVGPSIDRPAPDMPLTQFLLLSRPEELRVAVFHGVLSSGSSCTSEGPAGGGTLAISAKEGVSIIRQGGAEHVVHPGDSLTIRSTGHLRWINGSPGPSAALWIYAPALVEYGSPFREDAATEY